MDIQEFTNQQLIDEIQRRFNQDKPGTITPYYYRKLFQFEDRNEGPDSPLSLVPDILKYMCEKTSRKARILTPLSLAQHIYNSHDDHVIELVRNALVYLFEVGVLEKVWFIDGDFADQDMIDEIDQWYKEEGKWYVDGYEVPECPYTFTYGASKELSSKHGTLVTD